MSRKRAAKDRSKHLATPPRGGSRTTRSVVIIAIVLCAVAAALWWGRTDRTADTAPTHAGAELTEALNLPEAAQTLVGGWQRTDAGYVIDIRSVDRFGVVDAAYLNPNPIHVSQARASDAHGPLELFVELMDVGYPGATYRLQYNPEYDALVGLYHQPTAGQDFDVAFRRK